MPSGNLESRLLAPTHLAVRNEIFLVIHGLNLHPDRMGPWSDLLRGQGYPVVQVALTGHDPKAREAWSTVTADQWMDDLSRALERARSRWQGASISLCGYSLGAVTGLAWSLERGISLNRAVLIAPALRVRGWLAPLLKLSAYWPRGRVSFPSFAPRSYRAHGTTSLAAYRSLQEMIDRFEGGAERSEDFPQLVIYAKRDELISTTFLREYQQRHRRSVQLLPLDLSLVRRYPLHLAIDARTMGNAEWQRISAVASAWLSATRTAEPR